MGAATRETTPTFIPPHETLVDILVWRAQATPERLAYGFLDAEGNVVASLTYGELDRAARQVAAHLAAAGVAGTNVPILFETSPDFAAAMYGCFYAGVIPVPLQPGRGKKATLRLQSVLQSCSPKALLTTSGLAETLAGTLAPFAHSIDVLRTDVFEPIGSVEPVSSYSSSVAFLQYTSGSTSQPKGTMVTHENLLANLEMFRGMIGLGHEDVTVSWLPLSHDMGLIGNLLLTVYAGARAFLLTTKSFISNPLVWLDAFTRYRGTYACAPNFAYELCVAHAGSRDLAGLDLSTWRIAVNGAEPIRKKTLDGFVRAFGPYGFDARTFFPGYGLAEATLAVACTGARVAAELQIDGEALKAGRVQATEGSDPEAYSLVSCGPLAYGDQVVRIVDPVTRVECAGHAVGEIWVSGRHVAAGYWGLGEVSEQTFRARLHGDDDRTYLRTGDLGFIHGGELYVTGRIKDLILVAGENHYPQDIERTVESVSSEVRPGCVAAFAHEHDEAAGVMIVAETRCEAAGEATRELMAAIRRAVGESHELPVISIALVPPGTVPKTTSGKTQRRQCRSELLAGQYPCIDRWTLEVSKDVDASGEPLTAEQLRRWMAGWLAEQLGVPENRVTMHTPFMDLGLDSARGVQMTRALSQKLEREVGTALLWRFPTIYDLCTCLASQEPRDSSNDLARDAVAQGSVEDELDAEIARLEGQE